MALREALLLSSLTACPASAKEPSSTAAVPEAAVPEATDLSGVNPGIVNAVDKSCPDLDSCRQQMAEAFRLLDYSTDALRLARARFLNERLLANVLNAQVQGTEIRVLNENGNIYVWAPTQNTPMHGSEGAKLFKTKDNEGERGQDFSTWGNWVVGVYFRVEAPSKGIVEHVISAYDAETSTYGSWIFIDEGLAPPGTQVILSSEEVREGTLGWCESGILPESESVFIVATACHNDVLILGEYPEKISGSLRER